MTKRWTNDRTAFRQSGVGAWPKSADDLMRHGTHDFPILVRDAKQTAPHEKTEYIEAGSKGISESTCREGRFIHAPQFVRVYKLALFMFWSFRDRVANSCGVSPSRLVCGRFRL